MYRLAHAYTTMGANGAKRLCIWGKTPTRLFAPNFGRRFAPLTLIKDNVQNHVLLHYRPYDIISITTKGIFFTYCMCLFVSWFIPRMLTHTH